MSNKQVTHVNYEELIAFAKDVKKLSDSLENYFSETEKGLNRLGETHKDHKYEEFREKFYEDLKILKPLAEAMDGYAKHIEVKWGPKIMDYIKAQMHK